MELQTVNVGVSFSLSLSEALERVDSAATQIFAADERVHAVGVSVRNGAPIFRAIRNRNKVLPLSTAARSTLTHVDTIPVVYVDAGDDATPLFQVPVTPTALVAATIPEQQPHRPLLCGLQVQNIDDDDRQGRLQNGVMTVGTAGCYVKRQGGGAFILSNNHVLAGENRGIRNSDRILQHGGATFDENLLTATLEDFVELRFSPPGLRSGEPGIVYNSVDAAIARVHDGLEANNAYHPIRNAKAPLRIGKVKPLDRVHKVGRTTGLTHGEVSDLATIVGPVPYAGRPAWFRRSITVESFDEKPFSAGGDSGAVVVNDDGEVIGLLYAGNGDQTFVCPIEDVVEALGISI